MAEYSVREAAARLWGDTGMRQLEGKTMLQTATAQEIRRIAQPIGELASKCDWIDDGFDLRKCAVLSVISQLAYCAISADERDRRNRAKLVPCEMYQRLLL